MRKFLIAGLLMLGAVSAEAATDVQDVFNSSCTVGRIYVSSLTATHPTRMDPGPLDLSTGTSVTPSNNNILMDNRKVIEIQNQDLNQIPYRCAFSSAPLTASVNTFGIVLASSGTFSLPMPARDRDGLRLSVWCRSTGALVSTAAVTQCGSK